MNYEPGVFAALANTDFGKQLWVWLQSDENVVRMKTATALGRPAVEGVEEELLREYEDEVRADRTKQMIGHMVRQIMERLGYVIDAQNVKVNNGGLFSRATRYKLRDDVTFHVFRKRHDLRSCAVTFDRAGSQLPREIPTEDREWAYWKSFRGALRGRIVFGIPDHQKADADVKEIGYHLFRTERMFRPSA